MNVRKEWFENLVFSSSLVPPPLNPELLFLFCWLHVCLDSLWWPFPILSGLVNSFFIDFVDLLPQDLLELSDLLHRILSTCFPVLECFVECCGVVMTWSLHLVASCCNMFEESASVFNKNVSKNIGNILQHCSLAPRHMLATWPLTEQSSEFHFIF